MPEDPGRIGVPEAVAALARGELVILPTETVYGLGAGALHPAAVARIFAAKGRPRFNPIICHVASLEQLSRYARLPKHLPLEFWPGPLTILLPHEGRIPAIVTSGSPLCGFRIPDHPLMLDVLTQLDTPVAAPSANRSGRVSPTTVGMACAEVGASVAGFLDGGPCRLGLESTVILPQGDGRTVRVLRQGGVTEEQLRAGGLEVIRSTGPDPRGNAAAEPATPGTQFVHYSPEAPLILVDVESRSLSTDDGTTLHETVARLGFRELLVLCFGDLPAGVPPQKESFNLSPSGDLIEAAAQLFSALGAAATGRVDAILTFAVPDRDLGRAINDRLQRAATYMAHRTTSGWSLAKRTETAP